jgi:hypothetical protein
MSDSGTETGLNAASRAHQKALSRSELSVNIFDRAAQGESWGGIEIEAVKFRLANDPMIESLAVITGVGADGGPIVAFHSAIGFAELFVGLAARLRNGSLKWKVDEYRSE